MCGDRRARRNRWCTGTQVRIEQVDRRRRLDAARLQQRQIFGVELQRNQRRAIGELAEEDRELAARTLDGVARKLELVLREVFEPAEMALDFARKIGYRVEAEHLDCPRGLVDVHPRVLERRDVAPRPAEAREGLDPSRQRLVDLVLDPGQRAHVEFRDE